MSCNMTILSKGDKRSVKAKKNILASAIIKGADTLIYLLLVPLTLGYLNAYEYGIWITLSSILSWFNSFDIGLGSGLRNKLGAAMAENDREKGRRYVSTTFYMLIILTSVIFLILYILIETLDWYSIINVSRETVPNLTSIILVSILFFCINFDLKFIGNVYQALQLPAVNSLISFSGHLLSLVVIYIMTKVMPGSLFWVALVYSATPPVIYLLCYPITFHRLYPYLSPTYRLFRKEYLKDLLSLSILFFISQIMAIVLFSLSNLLISNKFGPEQVTPYNIAYRYFSLILMFGNLLLAPIWAAATDAYAKGDLRWISNCISKCSKIILAVFVIIVLMVVLSPLIYQLWVGKDVEIPFSMSVFMGIYMLIMFWSLCFSSILNGMGKLRVQTINIIIVGLLFYSICSFFANIYGVLGIVIGMCLSNLSGAVLNTIQLNKILCGNAHGIWNK